MADKIMETAREIASERYQGEQWGHMRQFFRDGLYDNDPVVVAAANALRAAPRPAHGTSATERVPSEGPLGIETSIDTMREAAWDLLVKQGWKPGSQLSGHSTVGLMAEFGMRVYRGEVGCGYPDCGCCADAACGDAVKQHPDLASPKEDRHEM